MWTTVFTSTGQLSILYLLISICNLSAFELISSMSSFSILTIQFSMPFLSIHCNYHQRCMNNPIFSCLGLCAACWTHSVCHHKFWLTWVSHPFSFLNSSLGFAGGKHSQKIAIPIFRLVFQNSVFPDCFPFILFVISVISLYFLLVGLLLQQMAPCQSKELV